MSAEPVALSLVTKASEPPPSVDCMAIGGGKVGGACRANDIDVAQGIQTNRTRPIVGRAAQVSAERESRAARIELGKESVVTSAIALYGD